MADVHNDIQSAIGEVFDVLRGGIFFDSSDSLYLLKASETEDEFDDLIQIDGQWFFEYNANRQALTIKIAKSFEDLTDAMADATHVRIESGNASQVRNDIYIIRTGDTVPPLGTDLMWKLYCERFEKPERYQVFT